MSIDILYLADQPHHTEELARLHHAKWGHLFPQIPVEARTRRLTEASGRQHIPTVVIAVDGSTLVGSAALVEHDMSDRRHLSPWLAAVFVKAEYRRHGIASTLVAWIESDAQALGVETLYLYTEHQEAFYTKRGWVLMEHADYHGTPVSVMTKTLKAPTA